MRYFFLIFFFIIFNLCAIEEWSERDFWNNVEKDLTLLAKTFNIENINKVDQGRRKLTPLMHSIIYTRNIKIVSKMIDLGADINQHLTNRNIGAGISTLGLCISPRLQHIAHLLLDRGAKINIYLGDSLPIHTALRRNVDLSLIKRLTDDEIKINARTRSRNPVTPLILGITGSTENIQYLLDKGEDINGFVDLNTPLMWACLRGTPFSTIKFLVEKGADISLLQETSRENFKQNILILATSMQRKEYVIEQEKIILFLIEKGADISYKDKSNRSVWDYIIQHPHLKHSVLLKNKFKNK